MTTATDGVAVIATQLAQTDRRALSQAWYSALHLVQRTPLPRRPPAPMPSAAHGPSRVTPVPRAPVIATLRGTTPIGTRCSTSAALPERRRPVTATTRRIEAAIARLSVVAQPTVAQTIELGDGRVRLLVRKRGATTRIVAVCAPRLRESVERALARARFSLAASGMATVP
jgi:hypothetical protein